VLNDFQNNTQMYFTKVIKQLSDSGAQGVILGCTEIPLLINAQEIDGIRLFSTTDIHCKAIVDHALA